MCVYEYTCICVNVNNIYQGADVWIQTQKKNIDKKSSYNHIDVWRFQNNFYISSILQYPDDIFMNISICHIWKPKTRENIIY